MAATQQLVDSLEKGWSQLSTTVADNKALSAAVAGGAVIAGAAALRALLKKREYKSKPNSFELGGGTIDKARIKAAYDDYAAAYGKDEQLGITDRSRTAELVDTFYNLVTDIYEWGWGTSFHFSPGLPGKDIKASEAAHEARIPALLGLKPGMKCLDVGCGVGGPMRTIASCSGANVVGVTINDYQVSRARYHNQKLGLGALCEVVEADFNALPFEGSTFDGAYAIEATCHAEALESVYGEVFRALRPGARFVTYEWVTTKAYDPNNAEHVRIIDEINFGNGLPEMRTYKQAEEAGRKVGFKIVSSYDLAGASAPCAPWYARLQLNRFVFRGINQAIVNTLSFLRLAPKGLSDVHAMLLDTVDALVQGGATGVFSPMHMIIFEKPANAPSPKK